MDHGTRHRRFRLGTLTASLLLAPPTLSQTSIDVAALFADAESDGRVGIARKTKTVDARPARPGEVIVTIIRGEGKETQSNPAGAGDMVVRNRCPETGDEEILVAADRFPERYEAIDTAAVATDGWRPFRPRGVAMKYFVVRLADGIFTFTAPWGEPMAARPGDAVVQDVARPTDTYRIAAAAFACTYEIVTPAKK